MGTIALNRPHVRNAMNLQMIRELSNAVRMLEQEDRIRLIVLTSQGENFCSGADLNWMRNGIKQSQAELYKESLELASLFRILWESEALIIASVKGELPGGAIGLLAASDFVVAERSTILRFSEVKLGLIPATISPYVLRKAGFSRSSDWMMSARPIGAEEAQVFGLIHRICEDGLLARCTKQLVEELISNSPRALAGVKSLLRELESQSDPGQVDQFTSSLIADFRVSEEGQEGMDAFFEKRKPRWNEES